MSFSNEVIAQVWNKGKVVANNDPKIYRKDECGAWMRFDDYGKRDSQYGWEIDHITPGGPDVISNLRPLQWENNVDKSDGRLKCHITSSGTSNIKKS